MIWPVASAVACVGGMILGLATFKEEKLDASYDYEPPPPPFPGIWPCIGFGVGTLGFWSFVIWLFFG